MNSSAYNQKPVSKGDNIANFNPGGPESAAHVIFVLPLPIAYWADQSVKAVWRREPCPRGSTCDRAGVRPRRAKLPDDEQPAKTILDLYGKDAPGMPSVFPVLEGKTVIEIHRDTAATGFTGGLNGDFFPYPCAATLYATSTAVEVAEKGAPPRAR